LILNNNIFASDELVDFDKPRLKYSVQQYFDNDGVIWGEYPVIENMPDLNKIIKQDIYNIFSKLNLDEKLEEFDGKTLRELNQEKNIIGVFYNQGAYGDNIINIDIRETDDMCYGDYSILMIETRNKTHGAYFIDRKVDSWMPLENFLNMAFYQQDRDETSDILLKDKAQELGWSFEIKELKSNYIAYDFEEQEYNYYQVRLVKDNSMIEIFYSAQEEYDSSMLDCFVNIYDLTLSNDLEECLVKRDYIAHTDYKHMLCYCYGIDKDFYVYQDFVDSYLK
jgi:hypothetical protein